MLPYGDKLNLKTYSQKKVKPFADKEQNTCLVAYFICQ